jgi:hypothetical protein
LQTTTKDFFRQTEQKKRQRISLPHSSTTIEVSRFFAINVDRQFGRLQYSEV